MNDLEIKLEYSEVVIEGHIFFYEDNAITMEDGVGFALPLRRLLAEGFGGSGWEGTKIKLTIERVLKDE